VAESDSGPLRVEDLGDGIVALWLARPAKRNALDGPLVAALDTALTEIEARAVVLGSLDSCFCSGVDLDLPDDERASVSDRLYGVYRRMLTLPCPIVAAIPGPAVGGGAQLAVASDLRVGGPAASLRFVGAGHGLAVGSWALPSMVGRGRALDLCLTMRRIDAESALQIGLLDRVCVDPVAAAIELAREIACLDPAASRRVRTITRDGRAMLVSLDREREANRLAWRGSIAGLGMGARG
jgi:enoyl-CoA hydratase/carnithine racemase